MNCEKWTKKRINRAISIIQQMNNNCVWATTEKSERMDDVNFIYQIRRNLNFNDHYDYELYLKKSKNLEVNYLYKLLNEGLSKIIKCENLVYFFYKLNGCKSNAAVPVLDINIEKLKYEEVDSDKFYGCK